MLSCCPFFLKEQPTAFLLACASQHSAKATRSPFTAGLSQEGLTDPQPPLHRFLVKEQSSSAQEEAWEQQGTGPPSASCSPQVLSQDRGSHRAPQEPSGDTQGSQSRKSHPLGQSCVPKWSPIPGEWGQSAGVCLSGKARW